MREILIVGLLLLNQASFAGVLRVKKTTKDFDKVVPVAMRASTKVAEAVVVMKALEAARDAEYQKWLKGIAVIDPKITEKLPDEKPAVLEDKSVVEVVK
jgi:hypothetical protein